MTKDTKFNVSKAVGHRKKYINRKIKMSGCNTSFNLIIEEQISKLINVQTAIELLLESKHDAEMTSKLKKKKDEFQTFVNKLMKLKDALNYQVNLCADIKNISVSLNLLVQQITGINDHNEDKNENSNTPPSPPCENSNNQLQTSDSSASNYYEPLENNIYKENEIQPIKPTTLKMLFLEIEPFTQEELASIPKYMIGRISVDAINKFVEIINKTYTIKYNLLSKPKSSLKGPDLQMYRDYKAQETAETKGKYFITELDIAKQQNKKNLDKNTYNLLVILRHTKRLYENRSARVLRFVIN